MSETTEQRPPEQGEDATGNLLRFLDAELARYKAAYESAYEAHQQSLERERALREALERRGWALDQKLHHFYREALAANPSEEAAK